MTDENTVARTFTQEQEQAQAMYEVLEIIADFDIDSFKTSRWTHHQLSLAQQSAASVLDAIDTEAEPTTDTARYSLDKEPDTLDKHGDWILYRRGSLKEIGRFETYAMARKAKREAEAQAEADRLNGGA